MPPIIGTAMRWITSDTVPVLQRIGSRPATIAHTVIILGRTRSTAPDGYRSAPLIAKPFNQPAVREVVDKLIKRDASVT